MVHRMRRPGNSVKREVDLKDGRRPPTNKNDAWTGLDEEDADEHKAIHVGPMLPQRAKQILQHPKSDNDGPRVGPCSPSPRLHE